MSKPRILVTGADLAPQALVLLKDFEVIYAGKTPQPQDVIAQCQQHNPLACIVRYGQFNAAMMDAAPALRVISKHGSGTDTIDQVAAKERGIAVVAAVGANAAAVAEQAAAMMLACAKSVVHLNERMHAGHWDKAIHKSLELAGLTVGLIGLGAIGQRFARICAAMDMRVIGFDPFAKDVAHVSCVDLQTIWQEADVISLHCPLTDDNRQLINAHSLAKCKRGLILVNTARGGLIDESALLTAVQSGQVGMAALDSFVQEPFTAPHPFQGESRILLSPHIGGVSSAAYVNMGVSAVQNVLKLLKETV